jgi:hypothetical protein
VSEREKSGGSSSKKHDEVAMRLDLRDRVKGPSRGLTKSLKTKIYVSI